MPVGNAFRPRFSGASNYLYFAGMNNLGLLGLMPGFRQICIVDGSGGRVQAGGSAIFSPSSTEAGFLESSSAGRPISGLFINTRIRFCV